MYIILKMKNVGPSGIWKLYARMNQNAEVPPFSFWCLVWLWLPPMFLQCSLMVQHFPHSSTVISPSLHICSPMVLHGSSMVTQMSPHSSFFFLFAIFPWCHEMRSLCLKARLNVHPQLLVSLSEASNPRTHLDILILLEEVSSTME